MKRFLALLIMLPILASCALAEVEIWTMGEGEAGITADCIAFEGEIPPDVRVIFEGRLLEDDRILSGARADVSIIVGDGRYLVSPEKGGIRLRGYVRRHAGSSKEVFTQANADGLRCECYTDGVQDVLYVGRGAVPTRLGAWTHDTFPKDATEAEYYHMTHALCLRRTRRSSPA